MNKNALNFINNFKAKFGTEQFDIFNLVYINNDTAIEIVCKKHGVIIGTPRNIINAINPCKGCLLDQRFNAWLIAAKAKHGNKYDYSKVIYANRRSRVEVICPRHGSFWCIAQQHLKCECMRCVRDADKLTTEEFVKRASAIFDGKYDYSRSVYTLGSEPITIGCTIHGYWSTRALSHLSGVGCMECSILDQRLGVEGFIEKARTIHGSKYDYSKVKYVTNKTKVEVICPKHGIFRITPNSHISSKSGCVKCRESYGELQIRNHLDKLGIRYIKEYRMPGTRYRMDFYLVDQNIYIEFHGKQHYVPVERFGGERGFLEGQIRDKHKVELAEKDNIPLIVLNYRHLNSGRLITELNKQLKSVYKFWFINDRRKVVTYVDSNELIEDLNVSVTMTDIDLIKCSSAHFNLNMMF